MRSHFLAALLIAFTIALPSIASAASPESEENAVTIVPLTDAELEALLSHRLEGGMQGTFAQFSNMFFVGSGIRLPKAIALAAKSDRVAATPLNSPFPTSYKPTLREFLDAIALQTISEWSYTTEDVVHRSGKPSGPIDHIAAFQFIFKQRPKPYDFTLAEGWKGVDRGNWLMLSPPDFPVGLDIYEMGTYSADDKQAEPELFRTVRQDVAFEWAQRVSEGAKLDDMREVKVGEYDALYFEAMIPSQLNKDIRWRQWVFMVDNACYFVVSTILPENEMTIFPAVESMLATFHMEAEDEETDSEKEPSKDKAVASPDAPE
jgi:hypothetical protein